MTIWKFPFAICKLIEIEMPQDARILHVECQQVTPCIWALVDPDAPKVARRFRLLGTGHHAIREDLGCHLGTFQQGPFVWHIFDAEHQPGEA